MECSCEQNTGDVDELNDRARETKGKHDKTNDLNQELNA